MSDVPPARILLRPLGSPLTAGMAGLSIASLIQSGVELQWTATTQTAQAGLILIAVPFVLQLVACVLSYLGRDGATGAAVGVLSTTWLGIGLVHLTAPPGATSGPLGLLLLAAGSVLALTAAALAAEKGVPAMVFGVAAVRFLVAGVYQLSGVVVWEHAAGVLGLLVCAMAGYAVLAFELEGQHGRAVLPTVRRGWAAHTISEPDVDPEQLAREPGVRGSL